MFFALTPFLLRDVLQRGISQYRNYCVIAELPLLSDMLTSDGTPLHCSHVFDVAWKATSSKRGGSSSCAVERSGKKMAQLVGRR